MTLKETLEAIYEAGKCFDGGTQITAENRESSVLEGYVLAMLVTSAKELGATGYEIERAMKGDFIGYSFT